MQATWETDYLDIYLLRALNGETWDKMKNPGVQELIDKKKAEDFNELFFNHRPSAFNSI
jgi:predicted aldo/keto reductase-like oxidoreductase